MQASRPLVSICIPTFNYAHYLGEAVASALDQSCGDIEVIVSDDASSDDTTGVMERFLHDSRVRYMPLTTNVGMFANFNRCWQEARGKYVKYLLADDWLTADCVERLLERAEQDRDAGLVSSNNWMIDAEGEVFGEQVNEFGRSGLIDSRVAAEVLARGFNAVGMPTNTLIAVERLQRVEGYDARYQPAADMQLWLKLLATGGLAWCEERLCFLRFHDGHTHQWAGSPDASSLEVWRDAPEYAGDIVDKMLARRAERNWSKLFVASGLGFLARGDTETAGRLLRAARTHAGVLGASRALIASAPQSVRSRRALRAARRNRLAHAYTPFPDRGRPLSELQAVAAAGIGPMLRDELSR